MRVKRAWRSRLAIMNRFQQVDLVGLGKSRLERRQFVKRQAQRVDIRAGVTGPVQSLRRKVSGVSRRCLLRWSDRCRWFYQPEISDPDGPAGVQQEVGGLDVAVDDSLAVGISQSRGDLRAHLGHPAKNKQGQPLPRPPSSAMPPGSDAGPLSSRTAPPQAARYGR